MTHKFGEISNVSIFSMPLHCGKPFHIRATINKASYAHIKHYFQRKQYIGVH